MAMDQVVAATRPASEERAEPVLDETAALTAAGCLFHGFSDPSRLAIVRHLALGEHRVVDLTRHLGLAQSTVSKHLACLRDCGLVTSRPDGRASQWSLNHQDTVLELLTAAEQLLALTGDAVTLCPTSHGPTSHGPTSHQHGPHEHGPHEHGVHTHEPVEAR